MGFTNAQRISVVSPNGETALYTDLNLAIQGAQAGSTIYLPSGGFQLSDATKITKKLTIMGVGHRSNNDNPDGYTLVSGNLFFEEGSDGSAVLGLYLSGTVNIGTSTTAVNDFLLRYCNVYIINVQNSNCQGIEINQNYLRNSSNGSGSPIIFSNNILYSLWNINGGVIKNNIIVYNISPLRSLSGCQIYNNIIFCASQTSNDVWGSVFEKNLGTEWIADTKVSNWADIFEGPYSGINPNNNYNLKPGAPGKNAGTDGKDIGIYGGSGFKDTALPPGPRIVASKIADQTDASGNLSVEITVSVEQ